jgi:4-amino-4-deoxy-L-arabinose transferase-like glycosyltransferase
MTAAIAEAVEPDGQDTAELIAGSPLGEGPQSPRATDRVPWPGRPLQAVFARHVDAWLAGSLMLVILIVHAVNITGFPNVSDDEGTYLARAWAIQHGEGLAQYSYWYDHPPFGWIQIAALSWMPALLYHGSQVVMHARIIMLPVTAVSVLLVYVLCRRLDMARWAAAAATAIFGLSPLSVSLQRAIFLDSFAVAWMLGAFVLALSPKRHLWHHLAAGACAALAVLSKETIAVVFPALVLALWQGSDRSTRKFSLVGFFTAAGLVTFQYPLYALFKGELLPGAGHNSLLTAIHYQFSRGGSGNILRTGTVANVALHWWLVRDPIFMYAGVAAVCAALAVKRLRPIAAAAAILIVVAVRPSGYLPGMYVLQLLPFFAICIAGVAERAVGRFLVLRARWRVHLPWWTRLDLVALTSVVLVGLVAPHWQTGDQTADTVDLNGDYVAASDWIHRHVADPAHTRIVVDDAIWPDLVGYGFQPGLGAIWFYTVDSDPAVIKTLPQGWRDVDYLVSTSILRQETHSLPTVSAVMAHSTVVASFGTGGQRIDILKVKR